MSRPRQYTEKYSVTLYPHQHAIIQYYAWKYHIDEREMFRRIVEEFALYDVAFDPKEYKSFVGKNIAPQYKTDKEMAGELKAKVKGFLEKLAAMRG